MHEGIIVKKQKYRGAIADTDSIEEIKNWPHKYEEVKVSARNSGDMDVDHKADVRQYESIGGDEVVATEDSETSVQECKNKGETETEDFADSEDAHMEYGSVGEDEMVETVDSQTSVQHCQDEDESESEDSTNSTDANMDMKVDPDNLRLKDKEGEKNMDPKVSLQQCESGDENKVVKTSYSETSVHNCTEKGEKQNKDITHGEVANMEIKVNPCILEDNNGKKKADQKVSVQQGESRGEDGVAETVDGETGVQDYKDKYEAQDLDNSEDAKFDMKVDPDSVEDEDEIKEEPDSEPEELGEVPFAEEISGDYDDLYEPEPSDEPKMKEDDSKHDIKIKQENFELDWKPYRIESECGKPKCKECAKVFTCVKSLKMHVLNVHILKKSKSRRTKKEMKLVAELSVESPGKKPLDSIEDRTCMICGKIFNKKSKMKLHLVLHTKVYKNLNVEGKALTSEDGISGTCLECGKLLGNTKNIKSHMAQVHYQLHNSLDLNNMDNYDLSEGGTTVKKGGADRKKKNPNQIFVCEYCVRQFKDRGCLRKHTRFVHEGESRNASNKTWLCEFCDKQFSDNKGLKRHRQFKHEGFGYVCDICEYTAITPLGLVKHRSSKHGITLLEVPEEVSSSSYQCMECGKYYSSSNALKRHIYIHTGERPFGCDQCGKGFIVKAALDEHRKKHTGEIPYPCNVCEIKFTTKAAFEDHRLKVHDFVSAPIV